MSDNVNVLLPIVSGVIHGLNDSNKIKRKKALEELDSLSLMLSNSQETIVLTSGDREQFNELITNVVLRLNDSSEVNRQLAIDSLLKFTRQGWLNEKNLVCIIPSLHSRIGKEPIQEDSEDVRLSGVLLIQALTHQFQSKMVHYLNDVINILKVLVLDKSPEVRKVACECVSVYALAAKEKFQMQSSSLIKPLLKSLQHQRFRIRVASIMALGDIALYGEDKGLEEISGPLTQCFLDLPQVRLAVVSVGGILALKLPDRYSYWHRILPLILTGVKDEDSDVKSKACQVWTECGKQYEIENEEQLKEELSFDSPLAHYPENETYWGLGCRCLTRQSLHHILPGLLRDLDDWQEGPRYKAACLLTILILNAQQFITQYLSRVLEALYLAASDKNNEIVEEVLYCAFVLGHFVTPETLLPLTLPRLSGDKSAHCIIYVLAAVMRGIKKEHLEYCHPEILESLSQEEILHTRTVEHQTAILDLVDIILEKCVISQGNHSTFRILIYILASASNEQLITRAQKSIQMLAGHQHNDQVVELYKTHIGAMLIQLQESSSMWTQHTPEFHVFSALLDHAGLAIGEEMEIVMAILKVSMRQSKDKDPFVTLGCMTKLNRVLKEPANSFCLDTASTDHFVCLIKDCIEPHLSWHAGNTAGALRTASISCLLALCTNSVLQNCHLSALNNSFYLLPSLLEDEFEDTRVLACHVVVAALCHSALPLDLLHKCIQKLIERLDDVKEPVRVEAGITLHKALTSLPHDYDVQLHHGWIQHVLQGTIIFLDDSCLELRKAVYDILLVLGRLSPNTVVPALEKEAPNFFNQHLCAKLIEQITKNKQS